MTPRITRPLIALAVLPALAFALVIAGLADQAGQTPRNAWALAALFALGPGGLAAILAARGRRLFAWAAMTLGLSTAALLAMPALWPGQRALALQHGAALATGTARPAPAAIVAEPPELAQAVAGAASSSEPPPSTAPLDALVLPYEGEGRRLTVPVVFEHDGQEIETFMMLDTGATYTTLPRHVLRALGALPGPDAPRLTLTTANGTREASVTTVDRVWLGDFPIPGVAITPCEDCAGEGAEGLLGLNVAGGFNVTIDADRREVVFQRRVATDRHLDIRPFVDLDASFLRYPDGRVDLRLGLTSRAPYPIGRIVAQLSCQEDTWYVVTGPLQPGASEALTRRLPPHPRCERYRIALEEADWAAQGPR